ncbi:hypothetical protein CS542_09140 [Pedobacter sp. IW39]|nr:hypothetical protein CS542_09140 [Pedobacter sp. IW39]
MIKCNTETVSSAISQLVDAHDVWCFTYTQTADGWKQAYGNYAGALKSTICARYLPKICQL